MSIQPVFPNRVAHRRLVQLRVTEVFLKETGDFLIAKGSHLWELIPGESNERGDERSSRVDKRGEALARTGSLCGMKPYARPRAGAGLDNGASSLGWCLAILGSRGTAPQASPWRDPARAGSLA